MLKNDKVGLQAPWDQLWNAVREFFKNDPDIKMVYDRENGNINMYVSNCIKADALSHVLPTKKTWGNVSISINIIPADDEECHCNHCDNSIHPIVDALKGNPYFHFYKKFTEFQAGSMIYVVLAKEVMQWWQDDLGDIYGNIATLPEYVAKDLFTNVGGVFFCTDVK